MCTSAVCVLTVLLLCTTCEGQIVEELTKLNIPPEDLVGNEIYTDMSIDEILVQALGGLEVAAQKMVGPGGSILAELDMNLTEEQYSFLYSAPEYGSMDMMPYFEPKRKKRKAVRRMDLRWENRTIPYYFARGHFSDKEQYMIKVSMREWEKYTCVKFRQATRDDRNYIRFQNGQGCNSQLGMVGGEQILNLDANGCRWKGLYLHEIGHALGLVHEHQLPNRDQFIEIIYANIAPSMRVWFQKYTLNEVNQFDVNYQLTSVMHYGMTAFSRDGKLTTIRPKNRTSNDVIGKVWRKELAFSDVKAVNRMYQCAETCAKSIRCNNGGFVDQNCKCICPDGTNDCEEKLPGEDTDQEDDNDGCVNEYNSWQCNVWATQGECDINPDFMKVSCKKACGICGKNKRKEKDNHIATWSWQWIGHFLNLFPERWAINDCKDEFKGDKCQDWAQNGDCVTNEEWMVKYCKKSCGECKAQPTDANCRNSHSSDKECLKWARKGDCKINKNWMSQHCKKACKLCNAPVSDEPDKSDDDKGKRKPKNRHDDADDGGGDDNDGGNDRTKTDQDRSGQCRDKHNTRQCKVWAGKDECKRNPSWMIPNCRKSCDRCDDGTCKNLYDDRRCNIWARDRECEKNKSWMLKNCAESCNVCRKSKGSDDDTRVGRREPDKDNDKDIKPTKKPNDDPDSGKHSCKNFHNDKECNTWAKYGHCKINPSFMLPNCKKACGNCSNPREDTTESLDGKNKDKDVKVVDETKPKNGGKDKSSKDCWNDHASCEVWAKGGLCSTNPEYLLRHCRLSCKNCENGCQDQHTLCPRWAAEDQCKINRKYMLRFCKTSCKVC